MKKVVAFVTVFLLGGVVGFVAAQPNQRQKDERHTEQIRRLAAMGLVTQKKGAQAATRLLAVFSERSLALAGNAAKRDVSTSLIAFTRLAGTQLHPWPITPMSEVDEITVQKRIEEFGIVLQAAGEANQSPQRNAGSRPSSDVSPASETPSSLGPRG